MHVRLKVQLGSKAGTEIKVGAPKFIIGREEGCTLRVNNEAISRKHCVILLTENEVIVRDLNSRNGTFVNDEKVNGEAVLLHGDVLKVGPLPFEMIIEQSFAKPKLSKVADIKEAVARTAEVGGAASSTSDLDDVTSWLDEADSQEKSRRTSAPETRQFRLDDSGEDVAATATAAPAKPGNTKTVAAAPKKPEKKEPGKLPPRPTTTKADSREAAADMLKKFFNRR